MTNDEGVARVGELRHSTLVFTHGQRLIRARVTEQAVPPGTQTPVVAFGHGFLQRACVYDTLLAALAARGYCVVAPDTESGPWPSHARFADDLWRVAMWAREAAPWAGRGRGLVLAGHSMGAGAALLAASRHPEVDAVVTLAALETRPPAQLDAIGAPTLFVVGSRDRIVLPAGTRRVYDAMVAPRQWAVVRGGYHCGFLDRARWHDAGCDRGDLPRREQLDLTGRLVADWLDAVFHGRPFEQRPGVDVEQR